MNINTQNIRHLMIKDGLKQKEVAVRLGMHPTAFNFSLSSGKSTRDVAERLAVIFRVPLSEIVSDDTDIIMPDLMEHDLMNRLEQIIDRRLEVRLAPLVEQMKLLNKLIDLANAAIAKNGK